MSEPTGALLLADLLGSVALYGTLDAAAAQAVESRYLAQVESIVRRHGGSVLDSGGDEALAVFAMPEGAWQAARELQVTQATQAPLAPGLRPLARLGLVLSSGSAAADALAAARVAAYAQGGEILATPAFLAALPASVRPNGGLARSIGFIPHTENVLPLYWQAPGDATSHPAAAPAALLRLKHGELSWLLGGDAPQELWLGRDPACAVVVADRRASRRHGRLFCRDGEVVYADASTNGSFVTQGLAAELFVRNEEVVLRQSGMICFAASFNEQGTECVRYELL